MKSLFSIALLSVLLEQLQPHSAVSACSYALRDGIYIENLRFVRGSGLRQRTQLAADLTQYEVLDEWDTDSTKVPSRINLNTGRVREASQPERPIRKDVAAASEDANTTYGYGLSIEGTEFVLKGIDGISISFKVDDFNSDSFFGGYSFFVDAKLERAYVLYDDVNYSTGTFVVNLNDGSVVARAMLDRHISLPHYDPVIYPTHQVAVLPGMDSMCDRTHFVYYDESSMELRFTEQLDDSIILTDKNGPLTIYMANNNLNYDSPGKPTPEAWSIGVVDLTTGARTDIELDGEDIQDMF